MIVAKKNCSAPFLCLADDPFRFLLSFLAVLAGAFILPTLCKHWILHVGKLYKANPARPRKVSRNCSMVFSCFQSCPRLETSGALCVQSLRLRHTWFRPIWGGMQEFDRLRNEKVMAKDNYCVRVELRTSQRSYCVALKTQGGHFLRLVIALLDQLTVQSC